MAEETVKSTDQHFFEYRNIRHVKTTSDLEESNDAFNVGVIEKYQRIDSGEHKRPSRPDNRMDLRHDPAALQAEVREVLETAKAHPPVEPEPPVAAPVAVEPEAGKTYSDQPLTVRGIVTMDAPAAVEPEVETGEVESGVTHGIPPLNIKPDANLGAGDLKAVPRKGGVWYDVVDANGDQVNKTPVRKKDALAFVEQANQGVPTE